MDHQQVDVGERHHRPPARTRISGEQVQIERAADSLAKRVYILLFKATPLVGVEALRRLVRLRMEKTPAY